MEKYILSCCSTTDLNAKYFKKRNIHYVCFHYYLDGKEYKDDFGQTIPLKDFYQSMKDGSETRTTQITTNEYYEYFESFLKQGNDILHIAMSSGISGSASCAKIASEQLKEKYPNRKLYVIDSLAASSGYGLLVDWTADLRDEGKTIEEVVELVEKNRLNLHHWFFSTDLTFYVKGGRVSRFSGFLGTLFKICPLLNVNDQGKLIPRSKIRTKKKAIIETLQRMIEHAQDGLNYHRKCFISHSNSLQDATELAKLVESTFKNLNGKVQIFDIGTTIGSHTGPGTIALFFWGDTRTK